MADPFVSVVLPVRNEEKYIARCLNAIFAQDYPPEAMEIIVADGESADATIAIIESLPEADRVRIVPNPRHTAPSGLNCAIAEAHGDIILRVDGHAIIAPDYVRQSVQALQETGAAGVGGCLTPVGTTSMGKAIAAAMTSRFGVPSAYHIARQPQYADQVYLGAWPRWVFERIGYFDEGLRQNQDYEFNYRVRKYAGQLYLTPAIRSEYYGRQGLRPLIRQFFNYGRAKPSTLQRHPASVKPRHLVAPAFVGALALGALLATLFPWARLFLLAILGLYFLVDALFSLQSAARLGYGIGHFSRLVMIFFLMHISYGAGFWMGTIFGLPGSKTKPRPSGELDFASS